MDQRHRARGAGRRHRRVRRGLGEADHHHALPRHLLRRAHPGGVQHPPARRLELGATGELGDEGRAEDPVAHHQPVHVVRLHAPGRVRRAQAPSPAVAVGRLRARHPRRQAQVRRHPEAVRVRGQVRLHLLPARPVRVGGRHGEVGEGVGVARVLRRQAGVAARAGPHAADLVLLLEHGDLEALLQEGLRRHQAAQSGSHDPDAHGFLRGGRSLYPHILERDAGRRGSRSVTNRRSGGMNGGRGRWTAALTPGRDGGRGSGSTAFVRRPGAVLDVGEACPGRGRSGGKRFEVS